MDLLETERKLCELVRSENRGLFQDVEAIAGLAAGVARLDGISTDSSWNLADMIVGSTLDPPACISLESPHSDAGSRLSKGLKYEKFGDYKTAPD